VYDKLTRLMDWPFGPSKVGLNGMVVGVLIGGLMALFVSACP
jgi:hypothetical protein